MNVRIRRYAEATNYAKVLTGVYNGIPKGENGMIIKYQEPAQPIKYMGGYDKRRRQLRLETDLLRDLTEWKVT